MYYNIHHTLPAAPFASLPLPTATVHLLCTVTCISSATATHSVLQKFRPWALFLTTTMLPAAHPTTNPCSAQLVSTTAPRYLGYLALPSLGSGFWVVSHGYGAQAYPPRVLSACVFFRTGNTLCTTVLIDRQAYEKSLQIHARLALRHPNKFSKLNTNNPPEI